MKEETLPEPDFTIQVNDEPDLPVYTAATLREAVKGARRAERAAISEQLRRAGATLPAPDVKGTIESAMQTGLRIALAIVEHQEDQQ